MLSRNLLPLLSFLVFNWYGSVSANTTSDPNSPTEIHRKLMQGYDRNNPPGYPDKPTEVKIGLYVMDLQYNSDDTGSAFVATLYLRQKWKDPRLAFATTDGKEQTIRLPEGSWKEIWIPDTFIRGASTVRSADDMSTNRLLRVNSNGELWYVIKLSVSSPVQFDLSKYPFDKQRLEINFESFGYTMDVLYFTYMDTSVDIDDNLVLRQFNLNKFDTFDCSQNYTAGAFPCLKVVFELERRGYQAIVQFYLPSILIVILSWLAFWIDLDKSSQSRLLIGIPSLIALILLDAFSGTSKDAANSTTSLNCWMTACYIFVFGVLVEFAVVNILSRKRSAAQGFDFLKPPFAGTEKAVEANGNEVDGGEGGGNRKVRLVDWFSRILFPIAFLLFNLIYWIKTIA